MKTIHCLWRTALLAWVSFAAAQPATQPVAFDTHAGYFVSNQFEPARATSFVVIKEQKTFDAVFGVAMVMRDKSHRLPPGVFDKRMVLAAIHRGKAVVSYKVESVAAEGKTLVVRYSTSSQPHATAEFACPLIVSLDQGDYGSVRFVENGSEIKRLEMQPPAAFQITCKEAGTLTAAMEGGKTSFKIKGGSGIGRATIRRDLDRWPTEIIVRVHLGGLESLRISSGDVKLAASVLSHSGNQRLLHLWTNGKEGPQLEKDSPYWMEIRTLDAEGRPVTGLPPKGGWFEMAIPKALLAESKEMEFAWIDFYR